MSKEPFVFEGTPTRFRSRRRIDGEFRKDVQRALPLRLTLSAPDDATVTVGPDGVVEAHWLGHITASLTVKLSRGGDPADLPTQELQNERQAIVEVARELNERILSVFKYGLNQAHLEPQLGYVEPAWLQWCQVPEMGFKPFPMGTRLVVVGSEVAISSEFDVAEAAQSLLDRNFVPLAAMIHLHRARVEHSDSRARWIDATIAAELAIKEFLARIEPKLTTLLFELPSPPLAKLYGPLLEHYAGQPSPHRKALIAGVERRNRLIHRPGTPDPDETEATQYVDEVQSAVLHLISLLDPQDMVAAHNYRAAGVTFTVGADAKRRRSPNRP